MCVNGWNFLENFPEYGKLVVHIDSLEKVMWQNGYWDPWGLIGSFMARHELEHCWCSLIVLWGPKWPWNSLNITNYMYDLQTFSTLLSSCAECSWCSFPRNLKNRLTQIEDNATASIYCFWMENNFQKSLFKLIQWILHLNITCLQTRHRLSGIKTRFAPNFSFHSDFSFLSQMLFLFSLQVVLV